MKSPSLIWAALLTALYPVCADELEYTAYRFGDNLDNEVVTTSFNLAKSLWSKAVMLLDIEMDQLTVPPIPDGVSGASRPARHNSESFVKNRGQIIVGLAQGFGQNTIVTGSYYHSREIDYLSHSFTGAIKQEFLQKNLTVELQGQYTLDSVGEILAAGGVLNRLKETHQINLSATQLLSKTTVLRLGTDIMRNQGYLSDPYRLVSRRVGQDTVQMAERHPEERWRQAAWGEVSQFFDRIHGSLVANYRYYWDDWGLESHTAQIKFNKYLGDNFIFSPEYRYYTQGDADFGDYAAGGTYFTGDYKLQAFESNNIGTGLTWLLRGIAEDKPDFEFLSGASVAILYFRYWNSLYFDADVFEGRIKFEF